MASDAKTVLAAALTDEYGDEDWAELGSLRRIAAVLEAEVIRPREAEAAARAQCLLDDAPRFWSKVLIGSPNACWPWQGGTTTFGHGSIKTSAGKTAHRYAWAAANGRCPNSDEVVRHRCDNPQCVNPRHLEIGSQADNVADMVARNPKVWSDTECRNGHPRTPENTKVRPNGRVSCIQCDREQKARSRSKRRTCPVCSSGLLGDKVPRHLRDVHGWSAGDSTQWRARAADLRNGGT